MDNLQRSLVNHTGVATDGISINLDNSSRRIAKFAQHLIRFVRNIITPPFSQDEDDSTDDIPSIDLTQTSGKIAAILQIIAMILVLIATAITIFL